MAALITEPKPRQLQVARLLQEEDDSWISSEELHTDGSSDEELSITPSKKPHHTPSPHSTHTKLPQSTSTANSAKPKLQCGSTPANATEPASQDSPHLTEAARRLSELGFDTADLPRSLIEAAQKSQEMMEQEMIMLWRPKRGSLKFPHLDFSREEPKLAQDSTSAKTSLATISSKETEDNNT